MDSYSIQRLGHSRVSYLKTSIARRSQAKVKSLRRLFCDGKPTVGCTPSLFTTARGTDEKAGGGYSFTKIDLADAYNQVRLGPESRERLAHSTHRGVLLQNVLPFGISSAPGYFQKIMNDFTSDLPGDAVYLDDILVSGKDANDHYHNLQRLLDRLHAKGLRCKREKCNFAQPQVEYLGHMLKRDSILKG